MRMDRSGIGMRLGMALAAIVACWGMAVAAGETPVVPDFRYDFSAGEVPMPSVMAEGLSGGTGFMEDYTYDFARGLNMGAHMLEVCPTFAENKPMIRVEPLGIGHREPPARLTFKAQAGPAILAAIIDMGDRFRMIVNDVECVEQPHDMPKLPVAGVLWKPLPNLETSAEAWILSGGAHHSVLSYGLSAEILRHFAEIMDIEFVHIGEHTSIPILRQELRYNDVIWRK